jgi:hypothetical protein
MPALTRAIAQQVAARIAAAPALLPQTPEGRTELVDAIMRHCGDSIHANSVMTELLDSSLNPVNLIAEIAAIANRTRRPEQPPPGCNRCYFGEDLATKTITWLPYVSLTIRGYGCARRCSCPRGRWLSAKDSERENEVSLPPQKKREFVPAAQIDVKAVAAGDRP